MFSSCLPRRPQVSVFMPIIPDFTGAGTLFTNGTHVLAGYQKGATSPSISGIGGKREAGETYIETALRETVEELFGFSAVPLVLLRRLYSLMEPRRIHVNGSYVLVIYNFNDLEEIIKYVKQDGKASPLYSAFPKNISELLLERNPDIDPRPEISHLCLVPVTKNATIDVEFLEDLAAIMGPITAPPPPSKIEPSIRKTSI